MPRPEPTLEDFIFFPPATGAMRPVASRPVSNRIGQTYSAGNQQSSVALCVNEYVARKPLRDVARGCPRLHEAA